jgi:hypothetical protein
MKKLFLFLAILSLTFNSARAQIGWTLDECVANRGSEDLSNPSPAGDVHVFNFKFGGWTKTVTIEECFEKSSNTVNLVTYSIYGNDDPYGPKAKRFTPSEIRYLLAENGKGITWERGPAELDRRDMTIHRWVGRRNGMVILEAVEWPSFLNVFPSDYPAPH